MEQFVSMGVPGHLVYIMAPNVSAMEECITVSEAKWKYIMTSPIMETNVSVSVS